MNRRSRRQQKRQPDFRKLWAAVDHLGTIDREMRLRNDLCHIPTVQSLPPAKNIHDTMNNCHVIGSKFLGLVRGGSNLLTWQLGPHHVASLVARKLLDRIERGEQLPRPESLIRIMERFTPDIARDDDCKYTVACHQHDDSVWKLIDTLNINLNDPETQFLLGYRSVISHFAWLKGAKRWAADDLAKDPQIKRSLRKYPQLKSVISQAQVFAKNTSTTDEAIQNELNRWGKAYQKLSWGNITTSVHEIDCRIPMAGTGIWRSHWGRPTFATILPDRSVQSTKKHTVLLSQMNLSIPIGKSIYKKSLDRTLKPLTYGLSNDRLPEILIELSDWQFLYMRKREYEKEIPEQTRTELEMEIANRKMRFADAATS